MKKVSVAVESAPLAVEETPKVHPLLKSHMIVSKRHVDYNNLTAIEAVSMAAVFILTVSTGVILRLS